MRFRSLILAAGLVSGCATAYYDRLLPAPRSPAPAAGPGFLLAGFGKADLTPPPGVGLAGNGPDGLRSTGWRLHLFARALVVEDAGGEKMAFVIADLAHISANIHRSVAALVLAETGIGADRLIVSATHTHSGPSHFYGEALYNNQSARVNGYDPAVAHLLVSQIAAAVIQAHRARRHAWATWAIDTSLRATRNRSYTAYCRNPEKPVPCSTAPTDSADIASEAQNHQLAVLRVDTLPPDEGWRQRAPAGVLSIYAIHGTGNPNTTTLLDSDIPGLVMRQLERTLGMAGGTGPVALFMNGTEGDASPRVPRSTRCPWPRLGPARPFTPVRGMPVEYDWVSPPDDAIERCFWGARRAMEPLASQIASRVFAVATPADTVPAPRDDLRLRRAFTTITLPSYHGLCAEGEAGSSAVGGAEDAQSRVWKWEPLFPFVRLSLREGHQSVVDPAQGCQREKRRALGLLQSLMVGEHSAPETAQFTVTTFGDVTLAAIPAEVTTVAGMQMRAAVAKALGLQQGIHRVAVIGLANGFLQYINTAEEYQAQSYEGGSDLYGPQTARVFAETLGELAAQLKGSASPSAEVGPITAYPGAPLEIMADSVGKIRSVQRIPPTISCRNDAIRIRWIDLPPGRVMPWATGPMLAIVVTAAGGSVTTYHDGDPELVIQVIEARRGKPAIWEATWVPPERASWSIKAVLPSRAGVNAQDGENHLSCGPRE